MSEADLFQTISRESSIRAVSSHRYPAENSRAFFPEGREATVTKRQPQHWQARTPLETACTSIVDQAVESRLETSIFIKNRRLTHHKRGQPDADSRKFSAAACIRVSSFLSAFFVLCGKCADLIESVPIYSFHMSKKCKKSERIALLN